MTKGIACALAAALLLSACSERRGHRASARLVCASQVDGLVERFHAWGDEGRIRGKARPSFELKRYRRFPEQIEIQVNLGDVAPVGLEELRIEGEGRVLASSTRCHRTKKNSLSAWACSFKATALMQLAGRGELVLKKRRQGNTRREAVDLDDLSEEVREQCGVER